MVASLAAALALALALAAGGARLRRLLRVPLPPSLRLPTDFALGATTLAVGVLALGISGALSRWPLAALVAAVAAGGRWRRRLFIAGLAAPALAGLLALAVAVSPPFFYDALVYHLALPWQALLDGRLLAHPENLFVVFPPLAQLVYTPPLAFGLDRAPALLHWTAFVAAGAVLAALARGLGAPRRLAALAAAVLPVLPSHVLVAGFPAAEGWMLAPLLTAYALLLRRRVHPTWPPLAGLLAGIACAARLQALPWAAGLVVLAAARARAPHRLVLTAAGMVLGALPWWGKNLIVLGAPLAPLGWQREGMETLWRDGGTLLFAYQGAAALLGQVSGAFLPVAPWLAALALAAALAVVQRRDAPRCWAFTAAAAGILAWLALASLPRFLALPAALLAALAAALRRGPGRAAAAAALLFAGALGLWRSAGLAVQLRHTATVTGSLVVNDPAPAFAAAATLPPDARVLFVGETRGYGFPRRFVAASQHDVSPLRELVERDGEADAILTELRGQRFTHLLVHRDELGRLAPAYPVAPWRTPAGRAAFAALLRGLGAPVVSAGGVEVYQLP